MTYKQAKKFIKKAIKAVEAEIEAVYLLNMKYQKKNSGSDTSGVVGLMRIASPTFY